MRALLSAALGALALSGGAGCAGGAGHHAHGPAGIPYACDGGQRARIAYEGGGYYPRGTAELPMRAARSTSPRCRPLTACAIRSPATPRPVLLWTARGEEAWLSELAADYSEREVAHCTRVREPGAATAHGGVKRRPPLTVADLPHRRARSAPRH